MKKRKMITTHNLGKMILEKGIVPTPIYISSRESVHIVKPRTIFANNASTRNNLISLDANSNNQPLIDALRRTN